MSAEPERIAGEFRAGGALDMALRARGVEFEPRPEQSAMAERVGRQMGAARDDATGARKPLLVEAGTGVGKSLAYLLPAAERIARHGERVVVSTHTISLQEQLLEKDVPIVREAMARLGAPEFRVALVKGRGNYVSVRRLKLASSRQERLFADPAMKRSLHVIEDWAYTTEDGTVATLPALERPGVWERAQSDSGNCMGRKCPTYEQCFYQRARREMEEAELLITNHALFFADLALRTGGFGGEAGGAGRGGFLPRYDHVVLDEAHTVEEVASEHFGARLTEGRVRRLLATLWTPAGRGFLATLSLDGGAKEPVERAIGLVSRCEEEAMRLFDRLLEESRRVGAAAGAGGRGGGSMRMSAPIHEENEVTPAFNDLALRLRGLKEAAAREEDKFELNAYAERAAVIAAEAEALLSQTIPDCVYWVDAARRADGTVRGEIACAPVEVGALLERRLFDGSFSVTMTSATLATGGRIGSGGSAVAPAGRRIVPEGEEDAPAARRVAGRAPADPFAHTRARLGCEEADTLLLGSPFDFARLVEVHVDRTIPDPRSPEYPARVARAVARHAMETAGGAFVLFTSFETLRKVARLCADALSQADLPMLVHEGSDAGAMSRAALLQAFRENSRSVLFGAASFWQGVDVRGEGLRNVIITRLPFEPPDRPLTQARVERIEARGGDAFFEDSLPRAVIRFKQAFGRLVRSHEDRGRVVVLDPRIVTKGYGRRFLDALPEGVRVIGGGGEGDLRAGRDAVER